MSSDGAAGRNSCHHGAGDPAGSAGDPLPEKQQRRRGDRSLPLQPSGSAHLGPVWGRLRQKGGVRCAFITSQGQREIVSIHTASVLVSYSDFTPFVMTVSLIEYEVINFLS